MPGEPVFEIHGNIVRKLTILLPTAHWHFMLEIKGYENFHLDFDPQ